ncbi:MAG: hypothetical protein HQL15_02765 [Candidatus Omnitrophica bacterium]|nr:hypothetical protein [Candidatus Omnitrophota bacterium]
MSEDLLKRGLALENLFFQQRRVELGEQRKKIELMPHTKETLAEVSGIRHSQVLDKMVELGVSSGVLTSLSILPVVELAWAEGQLDEKERVEVLAAATKGGFNEGAIDHAVLALWLKERPSSKVLNAWMYTIAGLREILSQDELNDLKTELTGRARKIIEKMSPKEEAVLKKMEQAFKIWVVNN